MTSCARSSTLGIATTLRRIVPAPEPPDPSPSVDPFDERRYVSQFNRFLIRTAAGTGNPESTRVEICLYNLKMSPRQKDWTAERDHDQKLVIACKGGDEDAWATVWRQYGPLVKSVARRVGCDAEEARDVLQRVALVALQKLDDLRDSRKLASWLAGIARFQSLELVRQRRPASLLREDSAVDNPRYDDEMIRVEDLARLRQAFVQLQARCQRLLHRLMLKEPADSYQDVARDENLSATSIGPIRRRCMKRLAVLVDKLSRSGS